MSGAIRGLAGGLAGCVVALLAFVAPPVAAQIPLGEPVSWAPSLRGTGESVVALGDVNGDGRGDVAVGVPGEERGGAVIVAFGGVDGVPGGEGFRVVGAGGSQVVRAGDFDGDRLADVLVATFQNAYVIYGKRDERPVQVPGPAASGLRVGPTVGFFPSVAGGGDVDGDGLSDVVVDEDGSGWVIFGDRDRSRPPLAPGPRVARLIGGAPSLIGGAPSECRVPAAAGIGDVDGDGSADVLVGHPCADVVGREDAGVVSVVRGPIARGETIDVAALGARGAYIHGEQSGDALGTAVSAAGDVDGDGQTDLLIGAGPRRDYEGIFVSTSAKAYVVPGPRSGTMDLRNPGAAVLRVTGLEPDSGETVPKPVAAGDLDGDGRSDLLVATTRPGRSSSGLPARDPWTCAHSGCAACG